MRRTRLILSVVVSAALLMAAGCESTASPGPSAPRSDVPVPVFAETPAPSVSEAAIDAAR
jgi:hypothetical protein